MSFLKFKNYGLFLGFFSGILYSTVLSSGKPLPFSPGFCQSSHALPVSLQAKEIALAVHRQSLWKQKIQSQKPLKDALYVKIDQTRFEQWMRKSHINSGNRRFVQNIFQLLFLENQKILKERECIQQWMALKKEKKSLTLEQKEYCQILKKKYNASSLEELWIKADIIPFSMAIAQAIEESGWGKSKLAQKKRSYFGMRQKNAIISYASSQDSVAHYLKNLNRHASYVRMRHLRAQLRLQKKPITGKALLPKLSGYCSYKNYVAKITMIMNAYKLCDLDNWVF